MNLLKKSFFKLLNSCFVIHNSSSAGFAPLVIIIAVALIAAAVPTTIILVQQEQDIRQNASSKNINGEICDAGQGTVFPWEDKDKYCQSGICIQGICKGEKNDFNGDCGEDDDCKSNNCEEKKCAVEESPKPTCESEFGSGSFCDSTCNNNSYDSKYTQGLCEFGKRCCVPKNTTPTPQSSGGKPNCNAYELTNLSGQYYGECKSSCDTSAGESPLLSYSCDYTGISSVCCRLKTLSDAKKPDTTTPTSLKMSYVIRSSDQQLFICYNLVPERPFKMRYFKKSPTKEEELVLSWINYGSGACFLEWLDEAGNYILTITASDIKTDELLANKAITLSMGSPTDPTPTIKPGDGAGAQPQPTATPVPPTTKGFCADGNRQYDKPVNTPLCVINGTVYRQQFDSFCHSKYGSPSDFYYECLAANAPTTASGYCSNSTKTSTGVPINNGCGVWNNVKDQLNWDTNYDDYCKEEYGSKDSQSNYFYKCPATTPTPPPTTTTPQPGAGGSGGTCQPGNPVETCSCPGTGNCSASTGGPAYTNWGCFTTSFDSQARCCPNDRRYACADGTCKSNLAACNASIPSPTPDSATTGCAAANPSAPTTGYECPSTTYGGCGGGLTCQPATNSQTGCLCKGTGSSSPTATPVPATATATPASTYTPPANCVNNPAYTKCGTATDAGKSCNYPGGVGYWGWKGDASSLGCTVNPNTHCYVCSYQ